MLSKNLEKALNKQIRIEAESSQIYLAMASWAEGKGMSGVAGFMYGHSDEERMHMLKLIKYVNERGGTAVITDLKEPPSDFGTLPDVFQKLLDHEIFVSQSINELVQVSLDEKDYATHNFLQWYVAEQLEEEALARTVLDKINLIGNDKGGLYLFDRDIEKFTVESAAGPEGSA